MAACRGATRTGSPSLTKPAPVPTTWSVIVRPDVTSTSPRSCRERSTPLARGVRGLVIQRDDHLEIRSILATNPRQPGAVGRYLDGLAHDRSIVVPAVVSDRLAGMLERRGFVRQLWWDDTMPEGFDLTEAWIRHGG